MDYTQLTEGDVKHMLSTIGAKSIDDFFVGIKPQQRVKGQLNIPSGLSELELLVDLENLSKKNKPTSDQISFLGAGIYDHFIPKVVDSLAMQSEFLTAYTPYQAEASQGTLQAFFEFQTMICQLTGMDVSNASLYESTTAAAEAMFMAQSVTERHKLVISDATHPDLRQVLNTYTRQLPIELVIVASENGRTPVEKIKAVVDQHTMAVLVQHPNFFGILEDMPAVSRIVHDAGALLIVSVDPISCGLLKRPGDYGADIVVGEGQSLGVPQQYGGPVLGLMACRQDYVRKMPGRLVGQTVDQDGRRAFCLTLQAREQHIRREKATSNVCTNQGLLAMRATVYMAAMGKNGIAAVAKQCFDKAHYAAEQISKLPGLELPFGGPFFKEFVVRSKKHEVRKVLQHCQNQDILTGVPLSKWYPNLNDCFLLAVTEKRTKAEIDHLVEILKMI